ncbi:hypothetical protein TNCV_5089891 [Trichonephila clavipes]|nr:hypothetical protein TNCV_5089891 [Trichonephila clavipes]
MSERHHLSNYDRGRVVERLEAGQSITTVAAAMGESKSVISRLKKAAEGINVLRNYTGDRERLRWCKEHVGWDDQNWSRLMFSDESRFSTSDSSHQLLWRDHGARYAQKFVCERDRYGQGVMMWAREHYAQ